MKRWRLLPMNKVVEDDDGDYVHYSECKDELDKCKEVIEEFADLISESRGVDGLHLNGDIAEWDWLINNKWLEKYGG